MSAHLGSLVIVLVASLFLGAAHTCLGANIGPFRSGSFAGSSATSSKLGGQTGASASSVAGSYSNGITPQVIPRPPQPPMVPLNPWSRFAAASATTGATAATATAASSVQSAPQPQPPTQPPATAKPALGQAESIREKLVELESRPASSLTECNQWQAMNEAYGRLVGAHLARPTELAKRDECAQIEAYFGEMRERLTRLRQLAREAAPQLDQVSALLAEYLDTKADAQTDPRLAKNLDLLMQSDGQVKAGLEQADEFLARLEARRQQQQQQPADLVQAAAQFDFDSLASAAAAGVSDSDGDGQDDLKELDDLMRQLVNKELELSDQEYEQLGQLANTLEALIAGGHLELTSARYRYMSGTLDAARLVQLHRLTGSNLATPPATPVEARPGSVAVAGAAVLGR